MVLAYKKFISEMIFLILHDNNLISYLDNISGRENVRVRFQYMFPPHPLLTLTLLISLIRRGQTMSMSLIHRRGLKGVHIKLAGKRRGRFDVRMMIALVIHVRRRSGRRGMLVVCGTTVRWR